MILQSREQRERADVQAALQGMEVSLREKEMASLALDRTERRKLQQQQLELDEDKFKITEEKAFQDKLTKLQMNEQQNLHQGAAVMFDTMFATLFRNSTAGGVNFKEGNYDKIVEDLVGKEYKFKEKDAEKIAGGIMAYGIGKDKPNALAMAELARFMKEKFHTDKSFSQALVRGGMVPDPNESPESVKAWLSNMEGLVRTQSNIHSLAKEWHDFSDNDPKNDLTMRPLQGLYDFSVKPGTKTGTGGGGGFNISASLMQLKAETEAIEEYKKERDVIISNTALSKKERDDALNKLKYVAYDEDKKQIPTSYQTIMGDYDVKEGYFGGGVQGGDLIDKNIYMGTDVYAMKEPEDAVDAIAERRDQLQSEKRDAIKSLKGFQRQLELSKNVPFDDLSDANKKSVGEAQVMAFREQERVDAINDAISNFYIQADIETEKYIEDSWWGAGNEARSFRQPTRGFPTELLTQTERDNLNRQDEFLESLRKNKMPGMPY